jgi:ketosteroid isomerase-like protein
MDDCGPAAETAEERSGIMIRTDNKKAMEEVYGELERGNAQPFVDSLADDLSWTVIGSTRFSQTYRGKEATLQFLAEFRTELEARIRIRVQRIIADGDWVSVQGTGQARTKAGRAYNNTYCWVLRLNEAGKIQEVTEYLDTELVTAAFGAGG